MHMVSVGISYKKPLRHYQAGFSPRRNIIQPEAVTESGYFLR